jgi:hypothetical protein
MRFASRAAASASSVRGGVPGTTGIPARSMRSRARTLSPTASMAWGGGPMKTIPASLQAAAKAGFSERKP